MDKNMLSKFQMKETQIHSFRYAAPSSGTIADADIENRFSGRYVIRYFENRWMGMAVIEYRAKAKEEKEKFTLEITASSLFEYMAENSPEEREQFRKLLTFNGAFSLFAMLRGQVHTATTALGLSPGFIVPSINLNHFHWEEENESE